VRAHLAALDYLLWPRLSMLDVINSVKSAANRDFAVRMSPRLDDLDTIVAHALAWERRLMEDRRLAAS
jgi:hypothetical protein